MRPILIIGGTGTLGRAFCRVCDERRLDFVAPPRAQLDITNEAAVAATIATCAPWLVVNAAGYVRVDEAELDAEGCRLANALGPEALARCCDRAGVPLLSFSSDLVFNGSKQEPYDELDTPSPLSVYGRTKHEGETRVLSAHSAALIVRTSAFFGPWDEHNFVTRTVRALAAGRAVHAADDVVVSPTYVPDLVHACLDLAIDGEQGLWHLTNAGNASWADLARAAARVSGQPSHRVVGVRASELKQRAPRPTYSALASRRGLFLPALDDALHRYKAAVS